MADKMVARQPHEGDAYWVLGGLYEVKAASTETGGNLTVMQMTLPAKSGPPPHTHICAEALYVVSGKVQVHISGDVHEAGPGGFFYMPAGTLEWFETVEPSTLLFTYSPGGMDAFFAEYGEPATTRTLPPKSDVPPDTQRLVAVGEHHGVQFQLPK